MSCTTLPMSSSIPIPSKTTKITTKTTSKSRHVSTRMSLDQQTPNPNLLTTITRLLWGPSLPPHLLISAVRTTWSAAWHLMMSQLAPSNPTGRYTRPASQFRLTSNFPQSSRQKPGTLHLYVGLPCPWAHRTLIVRALKGLETAVPVSIASPGMDGSWEFRDGAVPDGDRVIPGLDNANGRKTLGEVYKLQKGGYSGRSTVPMLWDVERKQVVCNESYDIIRFFNSGLNGLANNPDLDLSPPPLREKIDEWNQIIYPNVNNGVYRCGFAQSQEAYDSAVNELFSTLDMLDDHLGSFRYLCGDVLTLADICLFTTLVRFDLVYNVIFKCTKRKLIEFPSLHPYMGDIYQIIHRCELPYVSFLAPLLAAMHEQHPYRRIGSLSIQLLEISLLIPKVAATCNFGAIMDGYYKTLFPLNPSSIRPAMPSGCEHEFLSQPHNRSSLSLADKNVEVHIS